MKKTIIVALVACLSITTLCVFGCAPKAATDSSKAESTAETPTMNASDPLNWSESSDCTACHSKESSSMEDSACQISPAHSGLTCVACHNDSGLAAAHSEVTIGDTEGTRRLKQTEVSKETCLTCHEKDYTPEGTQGVVLVDSTGTEVNPHDLPVNDDHASIVCSNCHSMHSSDAIVDTSQSYCKSCHHAGVFACGTCHSIEE